jgi:hypothetical protein
MLLAWMTATTALRAHRQSAFYHDVPWDSAVPLPLLGETRWSSCAAWLNGRWVSYHTQLARLRDTNPEKPPRTCVQPDNLSLELVIAISFIVATELT